MAVIEFRRCLIRSFQVMSAHAWALCVVSGLVTSAGHACGRITRSLSVGFYPAAVSVVILPPACSPRCPGLRPPLPTQLMSFSVTHPDDVVPSTCPVRNPSTFRPPVGFELAKVVDLAALVVAQTPRGIPFRAELLSVCAGVVTDPEPHRRDCRACSDIASDSAKTKLAPWQASAFSRPFAILLSALAGR